MINSVSVKETKIKLGALCKKKRQSYKMSQEELGEVLSLSRYTIQKFENGKNATLDTVLKIANHFELLHQLHSAIEVMIKEDTNISLY